MSQVASYKERLTISPVNHQRAGQACIWPVSEAQAGPDKPIKFR